MIFSSKINIGLIYLVCKAVKGDSNNSSQLESVLDSKQNIDSSRENPKRLQGDTLGTGISIDIC